MSNDTADGSADSGVAEGKRDEMDWERNKLHSLSPEDQTILIWITPGTRNKDGGEGLDRNCDQTRPRNPDTTFCAQRCLKVTELCEARGPSSG